MNKQQESVEEMEKQVETRCALFKMKYKLLFQDFIYTRRSFIVLLVHLYWKLVIYLDI